MNPKVILKDALLLFVGACIGGLLVQGRPSEKGAPDTPSDTGATSGTQIVVTYFHGDKRCATCNRLERETKQALDEAFAQELSAGDLVWRVANRQSPENAALAQAFNLLTNAVVVEQVHDGKRTAWKNLEAVWDFLAEEEAFDAYVQSEVKAYLERRRKPDDHK